MIPSEIMEYSISQSTNINIHTTLKVLASPGEWLSSIPGSEQCTDNVVRYGFLKFFCLLLCFAY